jgi:hypothetical protein
METENHKITEMIMAPKFAKLLNESVDQDDFEIHKTKTIELVSEFVNKSFENASNILTEVTENLNVINSNDRLIITCEAKMKSITRDDRDNFVIEKCNISDSINESKTELLQDIQTVSRELCKILESSFESKEEYSKVMKSFRTTVSECMSKLNKIDVSKMETSDVTFEELSNILNEYKNTKVFIENTVDSLITPNSVGRLSIVSKNIDSKNVVKVREAVYLGTQYLMVAESTLNTLINKLHENTENILCEFVFFDTSSDVQFESAMSNIIRQNIEEDDEDFII